MKYNARVKASRKCRTIAILSVHLLVKWSNVILHSPQSIISLICDEDVCGTAFPTAPGMYHISIILLMCEMSVT